LNRLTETKAIKSLIITDETVIILNKVVIKKKEVKRIRSTLNLTDNSLNLINNN